VIPRIVAAAVAVETVLPRGMPAGRIVTLPWPEWFSSLGCLHACDSECIVIKCHHSICFRMFAATNRMPLCVDVLSINSEMSFVLIVGGKSSTNDVGFPAEMMMSSLGAMRSAVCSCDAEKDSCVRRAVLKLHIRGRSTEGNPRL